MENEIKNYNDDSNKIDLIDLFSVMLRYRKMIILGTLVVTILAGLYVFMKPIIIPKSDTKILNVTYVIKVQNFPSTIKYGLNRLAANFNVSAEIENSFIDYPLLAKEYKKYPIFGERYPEDSLEYNDMIVKIFGTRKEDADRAEKIHLGKFEGIRYHLNCKIAEDHYENHILDSFISEHLETVNKRLQERAEEYLAILENKTLESYNEIKNASSSTTTIGRADTEQSLRETLQDLQFYKENPISFYEIQDEPFVIPEESKGKFKGLVMVLIVSFFFFMCLALLKYFTENLINNKELMDKIKIAWNQGK